MKVMKQDETKKALILKKFRTYGFTSESLDFKRISLKPENKDVA